MRTRVVRRTHVEHGCLDRLVISSEGDGVELVHAIEFGFHIPARAFADVTIDTLQPRVRRVLKRHKLRLHHGVTGLPAEGYRLGVFVSLETAKSADGNKRESDRQKYKKDFSAVWIVEIDARIDLASIRREVAPPPAFTHHAEYDGNQAANQNRRNEHPREDADVRTASSAGDVDQKQQQDAGEAGQCDCRASQADVVAKQACVRDELHSGFGFSVQSLCPLCLYG